MVVLRAVAVALILSLPLLTTTWAESGRIKHKRLSTDEQQRALSEAVMNDGSLQVGDIVVTDRGYFIFEGVGEDGVTNRFRAIGNPSTQPATQAGTVKRLREAR